MKHFYKIEDSLEIKLIILYTMKKAERPVTVSELTHVILGSAKIDFFDIHKAMDFLCEADEVFSITEEDGSVYFSLTDEGKVCANHFYNIIPLEVRNYIDESILALFKETDEKKRLVANPVPISYDTFNAECSLQDGDIKLLDLKLYAGEEDTAKRMCRNFKENAAELYDIILKILMK